MWYAAWINLLIQQTFIKQLSITWWIRHDAISWGGGGDENVPLWSPALGAWRMTAAVGAPWDVPLRLCWVHTFGGLLPALWWYCCCLCNAGLHPQWLWPQGLSISLARSFSELLCDLRLCLPNFPSSFLHRSQTYVSLSSRSSLSSAPSADSFTGISPVSLLHFQSCLLFGGCKPTYLDFELLVI